MNRTKHSIQNSVWGIIYRALHILFPILLRSVIIRSIGAEYVGLSGLFKSILSVLNLSEMGFASAVVFMMYKPIAEGDKPTIRVLMTLLRRVYRIVGFAILIIGCAVFPFLKILVKNDTGADVNYYLLYALYLFHTVVSYLMAAYRSSLFTAHQRSDIDYKIRIACTIAQYALQILVLFLTKNYYLYLLVFALMIIPQNISYYLASKRIYPDLYCEGNPTKEQVKTLTQKIGALLGHRIGNTVIFSIDSIIISAFLGISILTSYDNYNYVMSAIVTILKILLTSILASLGNKLVERSVDETYVTFKELTFIWICIVGWCSSCLLSLYQPFIRIWVGGKYLFDIDIVICMVCYFYFWQFRQMGVTMKDAAGLWEPDKLKPYIGMALNLGLSILFVKITKNTMGVQIPTIFVMLAVYFPWETYVLFKKLFERSCADYLRLIVKGTVTVAISSALTYFLCSLLPAAGIPAFLLKAVVAALSMPVFMIALNLRTKELGALMRLMKNVTSHFTRRLRPH